MTPPSAEQLVFERGEWRQRIVSDYKPVAERLQTAYQRTIRQLELDTRTFTEQLRALEAGGLSSEDIRRLNSYQKLLLRIEVELDDFAAIARNEAAGLAETGLASGLQTAEQMAIASGGNAGRVVAAAWNRVDPAALARLLNYVDGAPLRTRFASFGANAANNFADTLLALVAQGKAPAAIANLMSNWYAVPFGWAANMTRTVQVYSYRGATHAAYQANSTILTGWVWQSALDQRVCPSCLSQHGSVHPLSETLNDHHQGRCVPVPVVRGQRWTENVVTGRQWFDQQPESIQRIVMGRRTLDALRAGQIDWQDFSQPYRDDVYGEMLRAASLSEMLEKK